MATSQPPNQRRPPQNRQIRTIAVVTTETVNPSFQLEPHQPATLPGYSSVEAPPKYTEVVKEPENNANNTENNSQIPNAGSDNNNGTS